MGSGASATPKEEELLQEVNKASEEDMVKFLKECSKEDISKLKEALAAKKEGAKEEAKEEKKEEKAEEKAEEKKEDEKKPDEAPAEEKKEEKLEDKKEEVKPEDKVEVKWLHGKMQEVKDCVGHYEHQETFALATTNTSDRFIENAKADDRFPEPKFPFSPDQPETIAAGCLGCGKDELTYKGWVQTEMSRLDNCAHVWNCNACGNFQKLSHFTAVKTISERDAEDYYER